MTLSNNSNTVITKNVCNLSSVPSDGGYKLSINRQHSLDVESFVENGQQKNVHYVIKGSAFVLEVALRKLERTSISNPTSIQLGGDGLALDFHRITIATELLYDCEGDKPVFKVRSRPLTTKGVVNEASPCNCKLETVVDVLSSQHEDMNFKIKLTAVDVKTGDTLDFIPPVYSEPFQVISKPDVLAKKKQKNGTKTTKKTRAKTKQDQVLEILARIENRQVQQQAQIDYLYGINSNTQANSPASASCAQGTRNTATISGHKRSYAEFQNGSNPSLETAYFQFVEAFNRVKKNERPAKLKKLIQNSNPSDLANLSEFTQLVQKEQDGEPQTDSTGAQYQQPVLFNVDDMSFEKLLDSLTWDAKPGKKN